MRVQCSIIGSTLGSELSNLPTSLKKYPDGLAPALTESPLRALQGNQDPPKFFQSFIEATSLAPPFNLLDCNWLPESYGSLPDDPRRASDALKALTFCLVHDYGRNLVDNTVDPPEDVSIEMRDVCDASTLAVSHSIVRDPAGNLVGIDVNPLDPRTIHWVGGSDGYFATGSNEFDTAGTLNALIGAVMSVDYAKVWTGQQNTGSLWAFNRAYAGNNPMFGVPPDGQLHVLTQADPAASPLLNLDDFAKSSIAIGYGLGAGQLTVRRASVQVQNITGSAIEYNFVEAYAGFRYNYGNGQLEGVLFYRGLSGDVFLHDYQSADIPLPSIRNYPFTKRGPDGLDYVIGNCFVTMLIGRSLSEYFQLHGITDAWMMD